MIPQRLTPDFKKKPWGATRLEPWFPDAAEKTGEVWFEAPADRSLLIKFLFTSENLSVQVHPPGKTEMWHILAAEPGARIAAGFRAPMTERELEAVARSGEIMDRLEWFDAAPGDTFFIPAGIVHAIGAGLALCEIQQHSDVTYRLYDYGRGRELHLREALSVSHLERSRARCAPSGDELVSCEHFTVKRLRIDTPSTLHGSGKSRFLIAIEGSGSVGDQPGKAGQVWSAPPDTAVEVAGNLTLLEASA